MDGFREECPYCNRQEQLMVLRCCFGVICQNCYDGQLKEGKHECPSPEQFQPLGDSSVQKVDACQRCAERQASLVCFNCSNRRFCRECFDELHGRQKFAVHKSTAIQNEHPPELECWKHHKQRNLVLQNCSLGCIKCAEELRLRKVSIVQDKENINIQGKEFTVVLTSKEKEVAMAKQLAEEKWSCLHKQFEQDFTDFREQLAQRQKEAMDVLHCMREQQLQMYDQLTRTFRLCSNNLAVYHRVEAGNPLMRKLARYKRALVHQQLKKCEKKKSVYESYEYKRIRPNFDGLLALIKSLGNVDKSKLVKEEEQLNRSVTKFKNISLYDNNRGEQASNRKRSCSKDMLNVSNISARKENNNSALHSRVKSTNRIDGQQQPQERRGTSRMNYQPSASKTRDRSIIQRNNTLMQSAEGLQKLNVNLFNQKSVSQVASQVSSQVASQYSTNNMNSSQITNNPPSLVPEIRSMKEEKFKNEFLHLRESMKKNSSYFGQHRPSIRK